MATKADPSTAPRLPLSRERILQAALALVDEGGIESLTMRRLGRELGFEAMSLYRYVAGKNDVLDGILALAMEEARPPARDGDWQSAIRTSAISVHSVLRRHPWTVGLLMSPDRVTPARLEYMDTLLGRLRDAGFSADTTYHAYHALDAHIFGYSLWAAGHTFTAEDLPDLAASFMQRFPLQNYPHLFEHYKQHLADGDHHKVSAFDFSLELILEGLERLRSAT